ncbi:unnamed protein product [Ilex paraguariensis]|uniref:Uncharacterized protein n=1 Tax=Ilex paraguariensis TaxID=185542 RepID=A0ABC8U4F9_9AQUA
MLGEEDTSSGSSGDGTGNGGSRRPCQLSNTQRTFWRSASWSSSRTTLPPLNPDNDRDSVEPNGNNGGHSRRFPAPLTPRSQSKARSCLPPLQPLAIARRSLDDWPKAGSDDIGEWPLPSTPSGRDLNNGGERLKLDLSNIQRNPDKNGGLVKREKIAFFDKECSKVAEHIYLGGDVVARDRSMLKQHRITHILNCVGFVCPEYFKADFVYRTLWLQDSPSEDITSILYDVFDYFEDVREQDGRVFVHCCQGVSRSTSLVIAYLMWREGQSFDDAFQFVKAARGIADPNMGFACQLLQCQKRVHAFPLSPSSLLRMYRMAPHSPYDPLHLVPKMLNDPSPSALDSRGAFIIHIPSAIYVWIGKKCDAIMERDARGAVCQIVRYEKVQGPIVLIAEGEEPSYFWDAFSNLLPLMDKSSDGVDVVASSIKTCPDERKVDLYNVDFEIFQKAILGGFVPPLASSGAEETLLPARESNWSVLRRKFASSNMKEFVSASKLGVSRVYLDSKFTVCLDNSLSKPPYSLTNSLSSASSSSSSSPSSVSLLSSVSSLSSSSSPPYLSPDSISSDSSIGSKYFSDSPAASPSAASCYDPLSATVSSFSSMSLLSSKISPQSISKTSRFIDVNFTSRSCSQSASTESKRVLLSIAERRGSMSKCLKLPLLTDDFRVKDAPSSYVASELDGVGIENNTYSLSETHNTKDRLELKVEGCSKEESKLWASSGRLASVDSCPRKSAFLKTSDDQWRNDQPTALNGMVDCRAACGYKEQLTVRRWPTLEKVATFGPHDLDSKCVFIFISPSPDIGKDDDRVLYFWVGGSFSCDKSKIYLQSSKDTGDIEEFDWNQASSDVLAQLDLPEDTNIMIVKEDEEPEEFHKLLSALYR